MDNYSISQNPAKSWKVGCGCALGFCATEEKNTLALVLLNAKHLCKWLRISLAKQFEQIQVMDKTQREEQSTALLTGGFYFKESGSALSCCALQTPTHQRQRVPLTD